MQSRMIQLGNNKDKIRKDKIVHHSQGINYIHNGLHKRDV